MKTAVAALWLCLVLCLSLLVAAILPAAAADLPIPSWRGKSPGTAYLGSDVLWRPREWLIFHMYDDKGTGFRLNLTVRDMNTYLQGARPVMVWVVGPTGDTLVREVLPDDGAVGGNEQYRDGIYDVFEDFRYREWHRTFSPGGYPPNKARSPYLAHPEKLPFRPMSVRVPGGQKGLYRVVVVASWDHWISLTPDRAIPTGIHPGPGMLCAVGDRFREAYLYLPPNTQDLGLTVTEEVQPYSWRLLLQDETGAVLCRTEPRTFCSYFTCTPPRKNVVYKLSLTGDQPGACLSIQGVPFVLAPDAETARKLHGGIDFDKKGRATFQAPQRVLNEWADRLKPTDLEVKVVPGDLSGVADAKLKDYLSRVPAILESQNLDAASRDFGVLGVKQGPWPDPEPVNVLATAAGTKDPANPYYGNAALIRRVLLARLPALREQGPYFWFENADAPRTFPHPPAGFFDIAQRSNWYGLGLDASHCSTGALVKDVLPGALPPEVIRAWKQAYLLWIGGHSLMHVGETSNQWTYTMTTMLGIWRFTGDQSILDLLREQCARLLTPGSLGRTAPDATPAEINSSVAYSYAADTGRTGAGYLSENLGWDGEYGVEQEANLRSVWDVTKDPVILDWLNAQYYLKTHMTLPKNGQPWRDAFGETCSPTDMNHRTCDYTHKTGLSPETRDLVNFGDLWINPGANPRRPAPCLSPESFVHVVDNMFYFLKTPAYYGILYAGPAVPDWANFGYGEAKDGSARLVGFFSMAYEGRERKATKSGGISAVFVPGCGPTLLSANNDPWYSNVVWGRNRNPIVPNNGKGVDPTIFCSGFESPYTTFDRNSRLYRKHEVLSDPRLAVDRTLQFLDDRILVDLQLTALSAVDVAEMYEALPYFADNRSVRLFDAAFTEGPPLQPLGPKGDGQDVNLDPVSFRALDVSGEGGAGTAVIFEAQATFNQAPPIRYREIAARTRSFSLPLPQKLAAGETFRLRYVLYSHAVAITPEDLRRVAAEAGMTVPPVPVAPVVAPTTPAVAPGGSVVKLSTARGDITLELFDKDAPITAGSFLLLVKAGFYNGLTFHRVVPGFVIQGGDPLANGTGGPGFTIPDELTAKVAFDRGILAMAKTVLPNSAGSQFFIVTGGPASVSHLNGKYAAFGRVVAGLELLDQIAVGDKIVSATVQAESAAAPAAEQAALAARVPNP